MSKNKLLLSSLLIGGLVQAQEFQPMGFDSIGMGGAGVANAKGSIAGYYNPALLAKKRYDSEISLNLGIGLRENNLIDNMDQLGDEVNDLSGTMDNLSDNFGGTLSASTKNNITNIQNILGSIGEGNGVQIMPAGSFSVQAGSYNIGVYVTGSLDASMIVDPNKLDLIIKDDIAGTTYYSEYDLTNDTWSTPTTDATDYEARSLEYALDNNEIAVQLSGLSLIEVPVSYAHTFPLGDGTIDVGGSLKLMKGTTYNQLISPDEDTDDFDDKFEDSEVETSTFGLDIGLLYSPTNSFDVGFVAKNLNSPEFDKFNTTDKVSIDPMARIGMVYRPVGENLDIAFDYDLTKNDTTIEGIKSQYLGGGINFRPASWVSLRLGAMTNTAYSEEGNIVTAGVGFGLKWFQFDLSAQQSTDKGYYDGDEIPKYSKVNFSLISRW
jgi:hypothetical protein